MKVNTLNHQDAFYQKRLAGSDITSVIYYSGILPSSSQKTVGIVGTRRPTPYGTNIVNALTEELSNYKINVISGLAIGIDSIAHKQALACGLQTTAVIPSNLEDIYPPVHSNLAKQILDSGGGLITLHQSKVRPYPSNFHERNQLLAAMCDAIVVVEAAKRSGTMITVRFGLEMGKPILAVPGRVGDAMSVGTNQLIATGAIPLLSAADVLQVLGLDQKQQEMFYTTEQEPIGEILDRGISEINQTQSLSGYNPQQFNSILTSMELDGLIRIEAGHIYKRGLA